MKKPQSSLSMLLMGKMLMSTKDYLIFNQQQVF